MRCLQTDVYSPVEDNAQAIKDNKGPLWCRLTIKFATAMQAYGPTFTGNFHVTRIIQIRCYETVFIVSNGGETKIMIATNCES